MDSTLKAVASFSEAAWRPIVRSDQTWGFEDAYEILVQWADDVGELGIGFDDVEKHVQWQKIDNDTMAYRIAGKALLVVEWDYDAELVGEDVRGTLTIHSWQMGTEAQQ